jgi:hypothetical protein
MRKDSRTAKLYNAKRRDVVTFTIDNRLDGAAGLYTSLLAAGYTLFDVAAASGGIDDLKFYPVGSYLAVWKSGSPASGGYTIGSTALSKHTAVRIMGIKLDANFQITSHTLSVKVLQNTADFDNKGTFSYIKLETNGDSLSWTDAKFDAAEWADAYSKTFTECQFDNCYLTTGGSTKTITLTYTGAARTLSNNVFYIGNALTAYTIGSSANFLTLKNCIIDGSGGQRGLGNMLTVTGFIYYNNTLMKNLDILFQSRTDVYNTVYFNNCDFRSGTTSTTYIFTPASLNQQWISASSGNYLITAIATLIATASYLDFSALMTPGRRTQRGIGVITRNLLAISYNSNTPIDDALKQTDDDDIFVEYRQDIETQLTTLLAAKIKNYQFYRSDGTTAVTTFADSEAFLIICTRDATATEYAVFGWYKGELRKTVLSEVYLNEAYTIVRCINIWEMPTDTSLRNVWNIDDAPIDGSLALTDYTSKVVS